MSKPLTLDRLLYTARRFGALDIHFIAGLPPAWRVNGEIVLAEAEPYSAETLARLALESLAARKGGAFDAAAWNDGLRRVIGRHRDLWLARNRAGGLRESMNVLEGFLKKDIR